MFRLETDLSGISITRLGLNKNEKGANCTLMYAVYKRARPIPDTELTADNRLALWTEAFATYNEGLARICLWEPGVLYRLPPAVQNELMDGRDLCAAPLRIEFLHTPYPEFTVDEFNRGSADGERDAVTTALHSGAYTPCAVAPRDEIADLVDFLEHGSGARLSAVFRSRIKELHPSCFEPILCAGDVRIEHLPPSLDRPVELIREEIPRETA